MPSTIAGLPFDPIAPFATKTGSSKPKIPIIETDPSVLKERAQLASHDNECPAKRGAAGSHPPSRALLTMSTYASCKVRSTSSTAITSAPAATKRRTISGLVPAGFSCGTR